MSDERINSITASNYSVTPFLDYHDTKTRVEINGSCLKQDKITYTHGKIVNIYIVYEISKSINISVYLTLEMLTLTSMDILDMQSDLIGEDVFEGSKSPGTGLGRNIINFGVDMSSLTKVDDRKNDILILGKGPTQGPDHTLSAEKMYSISFTVTGKKFGLSPHYNGANSYLFVNGKETHKFKAKDSEIVATPLYLGNISKDWPVDNMKKNVYELD